MFSDKFSAELQRVADFQQACFFFIFFIFINYDPFLLNFNRFDRVLTKFE